MNVVDAFLAPIYKYIILVLLIFIVAFALHNKSLKTKLSDADANKDKAVAEALKPYLEAEKKGREIAKEVSEEYVQEEVKEKIRVEKIVVEVPKIIERTVYLGDCFDDDGVRNVNDLRYTSEP